MKKIIGYCRISTKDQSNFSMTFQKQLIENFCLENNYSIAKLFTDEGYSAKNFDRPDWIELEKFVKQNHKQIDYLIVAKYDRFGRNVIQSLQKIELMETKYNIRIISVLENIGLHPKSPYFFKIRTDMLTGAQTEWLQIRERTNIGIRQARLEGRVANRAPIGYINTKDDSKKPIIIIDKEKSKYIKKIYSLFVTRHTPTEIFKIIKSDGLHLRSRTIIMGILSNPVYAGFVKVPASYDDEEKIIKGIHAPIISEDIYWQVVGLLKQRPTKKKIKIDDNFPLRGILKYTNGNLMTSYFAQGHSKKVPYYRVFSPDKSFNANKLHQQLNDILIEFTLPKHHQEYLFNKIATDLNAQAPIAQKQLLKIKQELTETTQKIINIEEDRINRVMNADTFTKWYSLLSSKQNSLKEQIETLSKPKDEIMNHYKETLPLLTDLNYLYKIATVPAKQELLNTLFDNTLMYDGLIYRTYNLYPIYRPKELILKQKGLLVIEQPSIDFANSAKLCPVGSQNRTLFSFLQLLNSIAA